MPLRPFGFKETVFLRCDPEGLDEYLSRHSEDHLRGIATVPSLDLKSAPNDGGRPKCRLFSNSLLISRESTPSAVFCILKGKPCLSISMSNSVWCLEVSGTCKKEIPLSIQKCLMIYFHHTDEGQNEVAV